MLQQRHHGRGESVLSLLPQYFFPPSVLTFTKVQNVSAFFTYVNYFWACSGSQLMLHNLISCDKGQYFNLGEKLHRSRKKRGGGGGGIKGHLSRFRELQGLWNERGGKKAARSVRTFILRNNLPAKANSFGPKQSRSKSGNTCAEQQGRGSAR